MLADLIKTVHPAIPRFLPSATGGAWARPALTLASLVAIVWGGWLGSLWGVSLASAGALLLLGANRVHAPSADAPAQGTGRTAKSADKLKRDPGLMNRMMTEVVALWVKQCALSRESNQQGVDKLLNSFTTVSDLLTTLTQQLKDFRPNVAAGATGEAIEVERPALDALLVPMKRAFAQRDDMLGQVKACNDILSTLQQWSKDTRDLAQHTRMVAFNSSIESARAQAGSGDPGTGQSISNEIRRVSEGIVATCDQLDALIRPLQEVGHQVHQSNLIRDTTDEELRIEIETQARLALQALFEALGGSMSSGRALQECSEALSSQMEEAFTHFQFGDRVAQMMQIVTEDMERLVTWTQGNPPPPTAADIQEWVTRLEANYTMDEQRSQHHDAQTVDRSGVVEFF